MPDRVKVELRPGHAVSMPRAQAEAYVAGHPTAKIVGEPEAKALEPAEDKAVKPAATKAKKAPAPPDPEPAA